MYSGDRVVSDFRSGGSSRNKFLHVPGKFLVQSTVVRGDNQSD